MVRVGARGLGETDVVGERGLGLPGEEVERE
jgi:hypothetical protein